jgi:glycosyltransferase involved in cell wall biosynthesis
MDGKILRMAELKASVIVPTRGRPQYLRVALESLAAQDLRPDAYEVLVVDDEPSGSTRTVVQQVAAGARPPIGYVEREGVPGLNSARNTGIAAAESDLIVFVDDDIEAPPEWLRELVAGRDRHPEALAFGGPIELRLEGSRLPMCGREPPPLTNLDGGPWDREIELVWGANMALDRRALEVAGTFDQGVPYGFDEDMWERRLRAAGGRIVYVARAGLIHRRDRRDARLRSLLREAYRRGRALRRYVEHRGDAPGLAWELRVLAGCVFHTFRYRCGNGILLTAHSAGRVREYLSRR